MAPAPEHSLELTLTDFVGLKVADDIDPAKYRVSVLSLVCEVALSKEIEREKASIKHEEQSEPAAEQSQKIQKSSSDEDVCLNPKPIAIGMRVLQVIKIEEPAEILKTEEMCYSPEPISVCPPRRPRRIIKLPKRLIEDYNDDGGTNSRTNSLLALQVTNVEDEFEFEINEMKRQRITAIKKPPPPKPPANTGPEPPPALPETFRTRIEQMGGTNPLLVIQKRLFSTDLTKAQNRLSIPITLVRNHQFLTEYEKAWLHSKDRKGHPNPIAVKIIDAVQVWDVKLKRWDMTKDKKPNVSSMYALTSPWHRITKVNGWRIGDLVQLWAFRVDGNVGFAIVKVVEDAEH